MVGDGERVHRAQPVPAVGVSGACMSDELGHQVDPGRVDVDRAQVGGEVPGPAAKVERCSVDRYSGTTTCVSGRKAISVDLGLILIPGAATLACLAAGVWIERRRAASPGDGEVP